MEQNSDFREQKELMVLAHISGDELNERYETFSAIDDEEALRRIRQQAGIRSAATMRHRLRYAAAMLVLIVAGAGYWYAQYTRVTPPEISQSVQLAMQQSIQSGMADAVIETDGEWWKDEGIKSKGNAGKESSSLTNQPSTLNSNPSSFIPHSSSLTKEQLLSARRITTRHDKEFWLTLDDGTLVHLNYNTRLIYPEHFGRGDRNVVLDGEAYFMVARDKSRPFIVHTPNGDVKVYGTEFNVNTSHSTSVVLVKGSVSVTPTGGREIMLKPGQQLTLTDNQPSVTQVDSAPYVAWNEGKFFFEEWPLERIMQVIARWYGREVEFTTDEIKQQRYSGNFDRYEDIRPTMEAIETITGLKITFAPGKLIIEP